MADQLGVCVEIFTLWENDRVRPRPSHYGAIIRFLGYDPEPGDQTLAGRLCAVRRRLGLSQADFAATVGLDEGSVCRWESGSRLPSRWMANRVAAILDRLETTTGESSAEPRIAPPPLNYFDRTRWRRRPPPELVEVKPATLGERIRARRLELGMSQAQLGIRLGVGRSAVARWERGDRRPADSLADRVAQFLRRPAAPDHP